MSTARTCPAYCAAFARHRGAALITSLLLLLVLTIIGVTAMQMTRMQERMAGNARDLNLAFQGSEAALRNGESLIRTQASRPDTCVAAPCSFWQQATTEIANSENQDTSWWNARADEFEADNDQASTVGGEIGELDQDPRYIVESIGFVSDSLTVGQSPPQGRDFYQVTSRSTGGSGKANTVLRTTYARRF